MKKKLFYGALVILILVGACSNPFFPEKKDDGKITFDDGKTKKTPPDVVETYTGTDSDGSTYELEIYDDNTYVLTVTDENGNKKTSTGKVVDDDGNGTLTLAPDKDLDETFTVTVDDDEIVDIEGEITFDDGSTKEVIIVKLTPINSATVTVTAPAKGETPLTAADTNDESYTCGTVTWSPNDSPFLGNKKYTATVTLTANENYVFAAGFTATINGISAIVNVENNRETATISLEFDATLAFEVTGISIKTQPSNLTYTHGDTLDLSGLVVTLTFDVGPDEDFELAHFGTLISTVPAHDAVLSHTKHDGKPIVVYFGSESANTNNLTVNKKALTVKGASHAKQYDTTTTASGVTVTLDGIIGSEDVTADVVTAEYTSSDAGTTSVNITAVTLTGDDAGNYTVTLPPNNVTVVGITKANPLGVTFPTAAPITYGEALSTSALTGGVGAGTFNWTDGTIIPTVGNSGYDVTFTPTNENYNTLTQNVNITVNCRIIFNTNGGSSIPDQGVASGTAVSRPPNPTRSGYVFDNWYADAGFAVPYNFAAAVTANSTTLYARWISVIDDIANNLVQVSGNSSPMSFQMGQNGDGTTGNVTPVHTVTFTQSFSMGKYEVTQAQYQAVMGSLPSSLTSGTNYGRGDNYPVYYVSWYDALVFCNKLSIAEGLTPAYRIKNSTDPSTWGSVPTSRDTDWDAVTIDGDSNGYRLPTEAQWEYAAKGGNTGEAFTYSGSDTVGDVAWYSGNNGSSGSADYGSKAVGTKAPNGLGLYDMSGNVYEWCWDWYGTYPSDSQTDPQGASSGSLRVLRGGGWSNSATYVRSAYRDDTDPYVRYGDIGFRILRP